MRIAFRCYDSFPDATKGIAPGHMTQYVFQEMELPVLNNDGMLSSWKAVTFLHDIAHIQHEWS